MDQQQKSQIAVAYERRSRDLDPQLVWRGKDEQDWSDSVWTKMRTVDDRLSIPHPADRRRLHAIAQCVRDCLQCRQVLLRKANNRALGQDYLDPGTGSCYWQGKLNERGAGRVS